MAVHGSDHGGIIATNGKGGDIFTLNIVDVSKDGYIYDPAITLNLKSAIVDLAAFSRRRVCPPKYGGG